MFTGLIAATGTVVSMTPTTGTARITVASPTLAPRLAVGDSIAVSGVCLTALALTPTSFSADLAAETLARTTLGHLAPGSLVNLELPTPAGAPLGGHVVQGHVDGTATLLALDALSPGSPATDWRLRLLLPENLTPYVVSQGSITVEGISLTVAALSGTTVEIAVIPHTYAVTSLQTLRPGALLNIETDVLARYAGQQAARQLTSPHTPTFTLTAEYLLRNGY